MKKKNCTLKTPSASEELRRLFRPSQTGAQLYRGAFPSLFQFLESKQGFFEDVLVDVVISPTSNF